MKFSYIRIDAAGKEHKEIIESNDKEEAEKKLFIRGIWYKNLKSKDSNFSFSYFTAKKISYKKLSSFSRNLSIYLKAGIPLLSAINLTKNQQEDKQIIRFLEVLSKELEEGKSLYGALESQKVLELPSFYMYSLQVAEESGTLQEVFAELAKYLASLDEVNKRVTQALVYPMFIIVLAVLMISFMLGVVVPKITQVFDGLGQELPAITVFVIDLGDFFTNHWGKVFILIFAFIFAGRLAYKNLKWFALWVDKWLLKVPLYKKMLSTWELARFSYITSILVHSGVTFVHAVKLATNTISNLYIKKQFEKATKNVVEGNKLSQALVASGFTLDNSFLQAIALGEETSEIDNILKNLSELYLQENNDRINMFLSLFEPFLILIVGASIGVIVTAMLLPIFSINFAG